MFRDNFPELAQDLHADMVDGLLEISEEESVESCFEDGDPNGGDRNGDDPSGEDPNGENQNGKDQNGDDQNGEDPNGDRDQDLPFTVIPMAPTNEDIKSVSVMATSLVIKQGLEGEQCINLTRVTVQLCSDPQNACE